MTSAIFELARFRSRAYALIMDGLITGSLVSTLFFVCIALFNVTDFYTIFLGWILFIYLGIVLFDFLNNVVLARITKGKSIGKALFNIRVLKTDYSSPGIFNLFKHWFLLNMINLVLSWVGLLINFLVMHKDPLKQGLHNSSADTIVVKSKTSKKKLVILWILTLLIIVFSTLATCVSVFKIIENISKDPEFPALLSESIIERPAESLSGREGPLAKLPHESDTKEGYIDFQKALKFLETSDFEGAKAAIDSAFSKNPKSETIENYRCYIYSQQIEDTQTAYDLCLIAMDKYPHNPSLISNQIGNAYYLGNCGVVDTLSMVLSDYRMDSSFDEETKSIYYGTGGVYLALCDTNLDLAKAMLQAAIDMTPYPEDREYYQGYLQSIE